MLYMYVHGQSDSRTSARAIIVIRSIALHGVLSFATRRVDASKKNKIKKKKTT